MFCDCEREAVPPVGECYGFDVIVDDSIEAQGEIYMDGFSHRPASIKDQRLDLDYFFCDDADDRPPRRFLSKQ